MSLCDADNSLLVVVDIQERLAGAVPGPAIAAMQQGCGLLLQAADILQVPVVCTEQYPRGLGPTVAAITGLLPAAVQRVEKTCFSCATEEGFQQIVEKSQRRQIILCGMEAHVCVLQTALQLKERGFEVFVAGDAVCSRTGYHCENALQRLALAGVVVTSSESVVFEWMRDARHEHFKAVSALLRQG